ncbi:MAG: hypothetical protein LQ337_006707 [Flavoplaca oasis]|nr:MAG: hypothetical protein LQ337_006707 [Flavoplaca oasis]
MAYNNVNQASGATGPAGGQSMPSSTTRDFQTGQPMTGTYQAPDPQPQQPNATAEDKAQREGHMPGLASVQKDNEQDVRQPGEEDAAGNKIQHKGIMKKLFHWEHSGMNAD